MLTGVPSPENGVIDYYDPLPTDLRTIAHELNERGYDTAFFGKWHLGSRDRNAPLVGEAHARMVVPPEARGGFAFWEGFESGFLLNDPWLHGTRLPEPEQFHGYQSDVVCGQAGGWMKTSKVERPWFAVVSLEAPHPPYDAPASGVEQRPVVLEANVPASATEKARRELGGYYAHIEATDRGVGRLLATLSEATIVVFTSVHGDMHGAHGLFRKGWPHEESVRVPLLVKNGSLDSGGRKSDEPVSLIDLPVMTRAWAEGHEWRCERDHAAISMPSVVNLPHQCDRAWRGVRTATRKLVLNSDGSPWLLFDLEHDPLEQRNRVNDPDWTGERERLAALG